MFILEILDLNDVKSAMYDKGLKTEMNMKLWQKRISHINLQRLLAIQSKGVVIGLLAFDSKQVDQVCEAFHLTNKSTPIPKEELSKQNPPWPNPLECGDWSN